jgi:amino acid transporter
MAVIAACYAEVASQFTATGGTYLYVRHALGRFAGLQVGWMTLLVRLAAGAASLNLLVDYLAEFWPDATHAMPRFVIITVLLGALTLINVRGASAGAGISTATAAAKIAALAMVCVVGAVFLLAHPSVSQVTRSANLDNWLRAILMGGAGAVLISAAAVISVSGFLGANLLAMPRTMIARSFWWPRSRLRC